MGAYNGVKMCLGYDLSKIARMLNYSDSNILVLDGEEEKLKKEYPQVYSNILSCTHQRDYRTPFQYAQDLVASWLLEDFVMNAIQNIGAIIKLTGADKNREILPSCKTSNQSDYEIKYNNQKFMVELVCDYGGYWEKNKKIDLRDNKYLKLKKENSLLLAIDILKKKFLIIDCKKVSATYIPHHIPWGGKPVYQIPILVKENEFSYDNIILKIKEYMNYYDVE